MKEIPIGAKGEFALVIQPEHLANRFKDAALPPVLATPVMIMIMENAALNAIKPTWNPARARWAPRLRYVTWRPRQQMQKW